MGFYGNITNTARTQFNFDRIYSNRYEMEKNTLLDGVYAGRYILIEYDKDLHTDSMTRVWIGNDGNFYTTKSKDNTSLLTYGNTEVGTIVFTANTSDEPKDNIYNIEICDFYVCIQSKNTANGPAQFNKIYKGSSNEPNYTKNYNIDISSFGAGRGYDSTVWQKTYSEGQEKYVMIAELNTVVPRFDVVADAPTMAPIVPHFDTQSTDVYYKLHWQAPWGFRVAAAEKSKSDQSVKWTSVTYDPATGIEETKTETKDGAIYFNKAGFNETVKSKVGGENYIKIEPSGKSGNRYSKHDGTSDKEVKNDIQEMTINLPAIGNMMSDAWDIIHGPNRDNARTDENGSLQGRLDSFKDMSADEIPVKRGSDGTIIGATINGGKTSTNDLTGKNDDAWIETVVNGNNETVTIRHTFDSDKNGNTILDLRNKNKSAGTKDTSDSIDMNNVSDIFTIVTPIVDQTGHTVAKNTQTITLPNNFKTIKTTGSSTATNNPSVSTDVDIIANNSKADLNIAASNKWIRMSNNQDTDTLNIGHEVHNIKTESNGTTNLNAETNAIDENNINIPDWTYDNAGHILSKQNHQYTLPFGFKTIKSNGASSAVTNMSAAAGSIVADKTQDEFILNTGNKWINIAVNPEADSFTIAHEVHATTNDSHSTDWTKIEANTTIPVITYTYDEAGHYTKHHTENYKLPFGYGKIKGDNDTSTAATATYDEVTFASDEWLTATVAQDKVTYSHDYPKKKDDSTSTYDLNDKADDTIVLETLERDDKGHVIKVNQQTVTLPYGYKTFQGDSGTSTADNTQDSMTVNGDNWISSIVSADKISLTHKAPVTGTAQDKSNDTPAFGSTFTIDDHYFDDKGHKFTSKTHTVQIPLPSLVNGTGNVCTGLTLEPASGKFTESKANVGTLNLIGYETLTSVSNGALSTADTINGAFGKLEYRIAQEVSDREAAINNLDVTDAVDNAKFVSGVSQTDGKITVSRAGTDALTLSSYSQGNSVSVVADKDTINTAFAKLQNQIDAIKGSGDIAENFDSIKEIADWLKANDSNADAVIDSIATLSGDESTVGSVSNKIKNSIDALDVTDTAKTGEYVSAVSEIDGKISVSRAALPTYTLTTGKTQGTVAFNDTDIAVNGLGTAAYTSSDSYAKSDILDTKFKFTADETYKPEADAEITIANLITIVANLQAEIEALKKANT